MGNPGSEKGLLFGLVQLHLRSFLQTKIQKEVIVKHVLVAVCVAVMTMVAATANAIEFQEGTKLTIEVGAVGSDDRAKRHFTYDGTDQYGHRFVMMGPPQRTLWLHAQTGNWVREKIHSGRRKGTYYNTIPKGKGFLNGNPGERWNFSYTKSSRGREHGRWVSCEAGAVRDGAYTVSCHDQRYDRGYGLLREITVDAETGMWFRRKTTNLYSGRAYLWEVVERPIVTQVR